MHRPLHNRRFCFLQSRFDGSSSPVISYFPFPRTLHSQPDHAALPAELGLAFDHSTRVHLLKVYFEEFVTVPHPLHTGHIGAD